MFKDLNGNAVTFDELVVQRPNDDLAIVTGVEYPQVRYCGFLLS